MASKGDPRLALSAVRARYNEPGRYASIDSWHHFTAAEIRRQIAAEWKLLPTLPGHLILNAGCGANDLGLCPPTTINLDISETRVTKLPQAVVGSIEALPFLDNTIDTVICVGSVINYCDAAAAISEFARVLRPSGHIVLEFESSYSAELMTQQAFGQSAAIANTFYAGGEEVVWVYTLKYICSLLAAANLTVVRSVPIHVVSSWALLFLRSVRLASFVARTDRVARHVRPLAKWASNYLLFCKKEGPIRFDSY